MASTFSSPKLKMIDLFAGTEHLVMLLKKQAK